MRTMKTIVLLIIVGSLFHTAIVVAQGPDAGSLMEQEREQRLRERVSMYWSAAKARDLSTMFQMELPAKEGRISAHQYRNALGTSVIESYEITGVQVKGKDAVIDVNVRYRLPDIRSPVPMTKKDPWTFVEEEWYHGWPASAGGTPSPGRSRGADPAAASAPSD